MYNQLRYLVLALFVSHALCQDSTAANDLENCNTDDISFELMTGFVLQSPEDIIDTRPDTLQLAECIDQCRKNDTCRSLNFETGLCVLFKSSVNDPSKFKFKLHHLHLSLFFLLPHMISYWTTAIVKKKK